MANTKKAPRKVEAPSDAKPLPDGLEIIKSEATLNVERDAEGKPTKDENGKATKVTRVLQIVVPMTGAQAGLGVTAFSKYLVDHLGEKNGAKYIADCLRAFRANRLPGLGKSEWKDSKNPTVAEMDAFAAASLTYAIPAPRVRIVDEISAKASSFEDFLRSKGGKASAKDIAEWAKTAGIS